MTGYRCYLIPLLLTAGCSGERDGQVFRLLSARQTGVAFENTITTSDSLNVQTDVYVYNGGGVATGDIDNDGLVDIFFSGNMVSSRLYLNKGDMRFEDITAQAGVNTTRWATGATMVDINQDGYLDIYVSVSGSGPGRSTGAERANLLFVNNGNRTFTEAAARYGIADTSFTTHAVFLDYDRDACLDLFLLNNSPTDFSRGVEDNPAGLRGETPGSYNELYRNECAGGKAVRFTNVSRTSGILRDVGFGLGVAVSDLNRDGWPDIYVSNDGTPNDVLYVNQRNGTFTDKAAEWLKHASVAGMGVDIADFNNDGQPDILQVDMMPHALDRQKRMSGYTTYGRVQAMRSRGFRDDYTANSLQLSNGVSKDGDVVFSEIARLAGMAYTDWSWTALFADFDNDGLKDVFISNGYPKAANDLDYQQAIFALRRRTKPGAGRAALDLLNALPGYKEANYVFRNNGDLTFADKTKEWGMSHPSYSYGAAYADLNNDGKLDLVVSNIDAPAFIYENIAPTDDAHHYLQVSLDGDAGQRGMGATLTLTTGGQKQYLYQSPSRGFMSTMDDRAHFGLGRARRVDSLEIEWPDGRYQLLTGLDVDRIVVLKQSDAVEKQAKQPPIHHRLFEPLDPRRGVKYRHDMQIAADYSVQPLLPYMVSRQGPSLAVADVNGDGMDDVFIGGGSGVPGKLFIQDRGGAFAESSGQPWVADKSHDDWGALFFDANGDRLPDLYVASGSYHVAPNSPLLQDRLYINQGRGRFLKAREALPPMLTSTAAVRAGDFNGDGRQDLFIGGRLTPRMYPYPTRSYVLRNDGGRFTDVTQDIAPELAQPVGMITDALWTDFDGDNRLDLVTVGEWMPIHFYRNDGKRLRDVTESTGLPRNRGWWYSIAAGDFDNDGRDDLVAGNLGLNYSYTTSEQSKFGVYAHSFTGNRSADIVLVQTIDGKEFPIAGMVPLGREIYSTTVNFPTYGSFAGATVRQLFGEKQLQQALHYKADTFASVYLHNAGGGRFTSSHLPNLAQISPIKGIVIHDIDGDGHLDAVVAGNLYEAELNTPRADAGNGLWLRGDGRGGFLPIPPIVSGLLAPRNVGGLAVVKTPAGRTLLIANTGDSLDAFVVRKP